LPPSYPSTANLIIVQLDQAQTYASEGCQRGLMTHVKACSQTFRVSAPIEQRVENR